MISLAAALVSMLNLETAMFAEFGADMAKADQQLMIMLTGAGIAATVIALAVLMIRRCTKEMKKMNSIQYIEETKKRLLSNSNYDMCIDNMLFNMWEELV